MNLIKFGLTTGNPHRRVNYCNNNENLTDEEVDYLAGRFNDIAYAILDLTYDADCLRTALEAFERLGGTASSTPTQEPIATAEAADLDSVREDRELRELCKEWEQLAAAFAIDRNSDRVKIADRMNEIADRVSRLTPNSFAGLRDILTVAATILSARVIDEDGFVGSGDTFGLVVCALRGSNCGEGKIGGAA